MAKRANAKDWLQDDQHFTYKLKTSRNGISYYQCTEKTRFELVCRATATLNTTATEYFIKYHGTHTHPANAHEVNAIQAERLVVDQVASNWSTQEVRPRNVLLEVHRKLDTPSQAPAQTYVSSKESLKQRTKRMKKKLAGLAVSKIPVTWEELEEIGIPDELWRCADGSQFIRYYGPVSPNSPHKLIICCGETGLRLLRTATRLQVDGTFATVPPPFAQIFVIHAEVSSSACVAVAYALLPDKKATTYLALFRQLKALDPRIFAGKECSFSLVLPFLEFF